MDIRLSRLVHLEYVLVVILFIHYDDDLVIDSHFLYNIQSKIEVRTKFVIILYVRQRTIGGSSKSHLRLHRIKEGEREREHLRIYIVCCLICMITNIV